MVIADSNIAAVGCRKLFKFACPQGTLIVRKGSSAGMLGFPWASTEFQILPGIITHGAASFMTGACMHPAQLWGKRRCTADGRRWHGVAATCTCQKKHMGSAKHFIQAPSRYDFEKYALYDFHQRTRRFVHKTCGLCVSIITMFKTHSAGSMIYWRCFPGLEVC